MSGRYIYSCISSNLCIVINLLLRGIDEEILSAQNLEEQIIISGYECVNLELEQKLIRLDLHTGDGMCACRSAGE